MVVYLGTDKTSKILRTNCGTTRPTIMQNLKNVLKFKFTVTKNVIILKAFD